MAYTLDYPSYAPFMKYSEVRELRKQMYMANSTKALGGDTDNTGIVKQIADLRIKMSEMLGYDTYAEYALEENMAKDPETVNKFISDLVTPSLPFAKEDVRRVKDYAVANGFDGGELMPWDFSYCI